MKRHTTPVFRGGGGLPGGIAACKFNKCMGKFFEVLFERYNKLTFDNNTSIMANVDVKITKTRKCGFTLAEVLVTLGIIGVVAAMTMPSVVAKYKEKAVVASLEKKHSELTQAVKMAAADYGGPNNWGLTTEDGTPNSVISAKNMLTILSKYYKKSTICYTYQSCPYKLPAYYNVNGTTGVGLYDYVYLVMADGTFLLITTQGHCGTYWGYHNVCGTIGIDINGSAKPNRVGQDYFTFMLREDGSLYPTPYSSDTCNRTSTSYINGSSCTDWVIRTKNMDYLHCDGLSLKGRRSCKD